MDPQIRRNWRFNFNRCISLAMIACSLLIGSALSLISCGLPSEDKSQNSDTGTQIYSGYFLQSGSNKPISGLRVTLTNLNAESITNQDGLSEIEVPQQISGDAELLISADWGDGSIRIEGIPEGTSSITYQARVDDQAQFVELSDVQFDGSDGSSGNPDVTPTEPPNTGGGTPGPRRTPTSRPQPTSKPKPTQKPGGGGTPAKCLICHSDRGPARCGDANWEALHKAVYKCRGSKAMSTEQLSTFELTKSLRRY